MNVFLLSAVRSGSTYLMHLLRDTGFFFYPDAHSYDPSLLPQREIREFLAPNHFIEPWIILDKPKTREDCIAYIRHKLKFMKHEPNLFKILMEQYQYYMLNENDRPLIESLIPGLKYIWLERSDIIARTVSTYFLFNSKVDHIYDQSSYDEYMNKPVYIDEKRLLNVYRNDVMKCDWGKFLEGTDYLKIEYEELIYRPRDTLQKCLDYLEIGYSGLNLQQIVDLHPKFKTERPESKEWQDRLRKLLKKRIL